MKNALIIFTITTFVSCNPEDKQIKKEKYFYKPVIVQTKSKDSVLLFTKNCINDIFPMIAGKYKFSDTIIFTKNKTLNRPNRNDYFDDRLVGQTDSTLPDGLEILPDYHSSIAFNRYEEKNASCYFPVYIINETPNKKALLGKDGYVFGLQEALDKSGYWRPIEGRGFDFCGHGYFGLKIYPNEFVIILFPKYNGDYKTKIRVRIKNADNIYISQPFEGYINENQLYLDKEGSFYKELVENKASAIEYLFYGAKPYGTDDKNFGGMHATYRFGR